MSDKYTGNFLERLIGVVERVMATGSLTSPKEGLQKPSLTGTLESVTHEDKTAPSLLRDSVDPQG